MPVDRGCACLVLSTRASFVCILRHTHVILWAITLAWRCTCYTFHNVLANFRWNLGRSRNGRLWSIPEQYKVTSRILTLSCAAEPCNVLWDTELMCGTLS